MSGRAAYHNGSKLFIILLQCLLTCNKHPRSVFVGGLFYLVNGEQRNMFSSVPTRGFVLSASNLRLISYFGTELKMPHDLAVSPDAKHIYVGEIGPNAVHKYSTSK